MQLLRLSLLIPAILATGCVTLSGDYRVSAVDERGNELDLGIEFLAHGRGIYSVRNAICSLHPHATVIITDIQTGQALSSESPYKCH